MPTRNFSLSERLPIIRRNGTGNFPLGVAVPLKLVGNDSFLLTVANGGGYGILALGTTVAVRGLAGNGGTGIDAFGGSTTNAGAGLGMAAVGGSAINGNGGAGILVSGGAGDGSGNSGGSGIVASASPAGSNGAKVGLAGSFLGDVEVLGNLSKGGGSFKIDHPLDPENKYLFHSFVE